MSEGDILLFIEITVTYYHIYSKILPAYYLMLLISLVKHDRDNLAAINIKHFAFSDQNLIGQTLSKSTPAESRRSKVTRRSGNSAKSLI